MTTDPRDAIIAQLQADLADIVVRHGELLGLKESFVCLLLTEDPEPEDAEAFLRAGAEKYGVPIKQAKWGDGLFTPDTADGLLQAIDNRKGSPDG